MIENYNELFSKSGKSLYSNKEILDWLADRKKNTKVNIENININQCSSWEYDKKAGIIRNTNGAFFKICGVRSTNLIANEKVEQPIIVQDEIGFLGIVCKIINGTWHFLMQAKIEPGNINYVQVSPTIQATKSNFTKKHGGKAPEYLDLFLNMKKEDILVDQIQSEQSSRFYKKRNRNVILKVNDDIKESVNHKWMTLRQIVELLHYDNLVNMDTRTVLSCIPYILLSEKDNDLNDMFMNSIKSVDHQTLVNIYTGINDYKMFNESITEFVPLDSLKNWRMIDNSFVNVNGYPFKVIFSKIEIEGREVSKWCQPLIAANGSATFGLICCEDENKLKVLIKLKPEIGCFDKIEIGPTIQEEAYSTNSKDDVVNFFYKKLNEKKDVIFDVMLSEEGGRFYHEQNRNVILKINKNELKINSKEYVWSDLGTLSMLTQINNCLNIQLRNMLTMLNLSEITK